MSGMPTQTVTRKRRKTPRPDVVHVLFTPELGKQVRELAKRERRALSSQVQLLVERALAMDGTAA